MGAGLEGLCVLATSTGNDGFPSVLRALKENGERPVRVIATDARPEAAGLHLADEGQVVPRRAERAALLDRLSGLCREAGVRILLPLSTEDQEFFAGEKAVFETSGIDVAVSPLEAVRVANDKALLFEKAGARGIPIPRFRRVRTLDQLARAAKELGYPGKPFVLRLDRGTGAQGMKEIHAVLKPGRRLLDRDNRTVAYDEVERWLKGLDEWPPMHACEHLPGREYSVDVLCEEGRVVASVTRLRLATHYGLALRARVVREEDVAGLAERVVGALGLSHVVNVQVRRAADETPRLIEVNPRIPGTIGLTVAAGVNMPYLAIKRILGEPLPELKARAGMTVIRHWDALYLPADRLEG